MRLISAKKGEPEWLLEWRLKALRRFLEMVGGGSRADLGEHRLPEDRLPEDRLLLGAEDAQAREPRRGRSRAAAHLRAPRHLALRAEAAVRRRRRRRLRQRLGRHHLQGRARAPGHHLLLLLRRREALPRAGAGVPRLGRPLLGQLLRRAELGGLHRRLVRLRAEGRALPDGALDLLPDQRRRHRPVRAHAADRRRGRVRVAISRAAPRRCATRTSCTRRWSSWSRSTTPRSSTRRSRTGTRATRTARAASTTS